MERSRRESAYIHQAPMRTSMMDAARKKAAVLQHSLDTQHHNRALSPIHSNRARLPAAAEYDAPNSPKSDAQAFLVSMAEETYKEVPTSPVGKQPGESFQAGGFKFAEGGLEGRWLVT